MEDFRFLEDNCTWIIIILAFIVLFGSKDGGCFNLDCLCGNLFGGCGNSGWIIVVAAVMLWLYMGKNDGCGFLRNDLQ